MDTFRFILGSIVGIITFLFTVIHTFGRLAQLMSRGKPESLSIGIGVYLIEFLFSSIALILSASLSYLYFCLFVTPLSKIPHVLYLIFLWCGAEFILRWIMDIISKIVIFILFKLNPSVTTIEKRNQ